MLHLHDTATGTVRPFEQRTAGACVDVRLRPDRLRPPAHRARPLQPRLRHPAPLSAVRRPGRAIRLEHHRRRRQHHQAGQRAGAKRARGGRTSSRSGGGRPWTGSDVLRPDDTPHATAYISDMVALVADLLASGSRLRDVRRRLPRREPGRRLRAAGAAEPRLAAGRSPGGGERGEALAARLRRVEEGEGGRAVVEGAVGARAAGLAHRVCRHVARLVGRRLRPARRRAATWPFPTTRTRGPRPWRRGARSPVTGCTTAGSRSRGPRCPSPSATSPR